MAKGFGGLPGGGLQGLMQQAQKMKQQLEKTQEKLATFSADGSAGGGAVKVTVTGKYEVTELTIDEDLIDPKDKEGLEYAVKAAINDGLTKVRNHLETEMSKATGGFGMPGLF